MRSITLRAIGALVAFIVVASCGSQNFNGFDGGADRLTADETAMFDRGAHSSAVAQQLSALGESLFSYGTTIDTGKTALENAQAVEQRVRANLGATDAGVSVDGGTLSCGSVSLAGNTVTVAFGSAPGCVMQNGVTVSGTVTVGVTKMPNTLNLALNLSQVTVNQVALSGSATFTTTNGTTFSVTGSITSGDTNYTFTNFTVSGDSSAAPGTITINGALNVTGDSNTTLTFNAVLWKVGDCYPSGGSIVSKKALLSVTMTFDASTPTTGMVTVTSGRKSEEKALPSYGGCGSKDAGP